MPVIRVTEELDPSGAQLNQMEGRRLRIAPDTEASTYRTSPLATPIDWNAVFAQQIQKQYILEPVLSAGRATTIYSPPKLGKSLLALEIAVRISAGQPALGSTPARPFRVMYVDFENHPVLDVRPRLEAMGFGPDDLGNLTYFSFPGLNGFDSATGGDQLLELVKLHRSEVVVIDTMSRAVDGEENDNGTWIRFYRHTGVKLKAAGVTLLRLDHSGKDLSKGQRGGSSKSADVDAVWRLDRSSGSRLRLKLEASRGPCPVDELLLERETKPLLTHSVIPPAGSLQARAKEVNDLLDAAGESNNLTREAVRALIKNKVAAGNDVLGEVVRIRKARLSSRTADD